MQTSFVAAEQLAYRRATSLMQDFYPSHNYCCTSSGEYFPTTIAPIQTLIPSHYFQVELKDCNIASVILLKSHKSHGTRIKLHEPRVARNDLAMSGFPGRPWRRLRVRSTPGRKRRGMPGNASCYTSRMDHVIIYNQQ